MTIIFLSWTSATRTQLVSQSLLGRNGIKMLPHHTLMHHMLILPEVGLNSDKELPVKQVTFSDRSKFCFLSLHIAITISLQFSLWYASFQNCWCNNCRDRLLPSIKERHLQFCYPYVTWLGPPCSLKVQHGSKAPSWIWFGAHNPQGDYFGHALL